jgi:diguanylate cyclase (GGDEF)-like protein/PAS domain S-box-containing protein
LASREERYQLLFEGDRRRAEEALRQSEEQYRLLFESNPLPMWVFNRSDLRFLAVNEAAVRHYGFSRQEFLAMTIAEIRPEEDIPALLKATSNRPQGLRNATVWRHRTKDGAIIDVEIVSHVIDFHDAEAELVAARDITLRKEVELQLQTAQEVLSHERKMLRALIDNIPDFMYVKDTKSRFVLANVALASSMGGKSPQELLGKTDSDFYTPELANAYFQDERNIIDTKQPLLNREEECRDASGKKIWLLTTKVPLLDDRGTVTGIAGLGRDITERKSAEERVQYLAYYDALTGLPNRTLLKDRLTKALASARRRKEKVALLFLDLDRFKFTNDSLGHSIGDLLLQSVAERLKRWVREQDTIARLGGDEFLLILTAINDLADVMICAERIMDEMRPEFMIQGNSINIGCSLGISVFPDHGADVETLIKNADSAMYSAKESGRNNYQFFTRDMNVQIVERISLENNLRQALERKELSLAYQPQMHMVTGDLTGMEALMRWQHPEMGFVPPDKFIRVAENSGLIVSLGEWALRIACGQACKWQDQGFPAVPIAVNVSAVQFRHERFLDLIQMVLQETRLAPKYLELELTESLLLANGDVTISVLRQLKEMGIKLAIDDFGTGYSSLSYLRQFPVSKLKIDRSFVQHVAENPDDAAIAAAIISMAKSLNDEIQGYYFSKPLTTEQLTEKLRNMLRAGTPLNPLKITSCS